jgi:hypothetical protein
MKTKAHINYITSLSLIKIILFSISFLANVNSFNLPGVIPKGFK